MRAVPPTSVPCRTFQITASVVPAHQLHQRRTDVGTTSMEGPGLEKTKTDSSPAAASKRPGAL